MCFTVILLFLVPRHETFMIHQREKNVCSDFYSAAFVVMPRRLPIHFQFNSTGKAAQREVLLSVIGFEQKTN